MHNKPILLADILPIISPLTYVCIETTLNELEGPKTLVLNRQDSTSMPCGLGELYSRCTKYLDWEVIKISTPGMLTIEIKERTNEQM